MPPYKITSADGLHQRIAGRVRIASTYGKSFCLQHCTQSCGASCVTGCVAAAESRPLVVPAGSLFQRSGSKQLQQQDENARPAQVASAGRGARRRLHEGAALDIA